MTKLPSTPYVWAGQYILNDAGEPVECRDLLQWHSGFKLPIGSWHTQRLGVP